MCITKGFNTGELTPTTLVTQILLVTRFALFSLVINNPILLRWFKKILTDLSTDRKII